MLGKRRLADLLSPLSRSPTFSLIREKVGKDRTAQVSVLILVAFFVTAILADLISPYPYAEIKLEEKLAPPSFEHFLGTDQLGRDVLSRIIHGTRLVIQVVIISLVIAGSIGILLGLFSGFYGGWVDAVVMRVIDILMSFPSILFALTIITVLGVGVQNAIIAAGLAQVAPFTRLVRGQIISTKELPYVENARSVGVRDRRIIFYHLLPNIIGPVIVQATFSAALSITAVAALSFFGLGAQPPTAEWGLMIYEARIYMHIAPYTIIFPGVPLFLIIISFNTLSEKLRDALDPKLRVYG